MRRRTIFKYRIQFEVEQKLELPVSHEILTLQMQGDYAFIWALVDPDEVKGEFAFRIVGTGHREVLDTDKYVGTYQVDGFVWHLFQINY